MGMENLPVVFEPIIRRVLVIGSILIVVCLGAIVLLLSGCGAGRYYDDNPRNMKNMTVEEIERELGE